MPGIAGLLRYVSSYQGGAYRDGAVERVDRWLTMFAADVRVPIASELARVLEEAFVTREKASESVRYWLKNPAQVSRGLIDSWKYATFLEIQTAGGSQHALFRLLDEEAALFGAQRVRALRGKRLYVYADDLSVHGMRILNDLTAWLKRDAPANFDVLLLLQRRLSDRETFVTKALEYSCLSIPGILMDPHTNALFRTSTQVISIPGAIA